LATGEKNTRYDKLKAVYLAKRAAYTGTVYRDQYIFDAELLHTKLSIMHRSKAADLNSLTVEHLQHCHELLSRPLVKFFNLIMKYGHVPYGLGINYIVPLPKDKICGKSVNVDNFRGITITCVISKLFEHCLLDRFSHYCLLDRFSHYFVSSHNQFGFKKQLDVLKLFI
jgi:hypothetical protein